MIVWALNDMTGVHLLSRLVNGWPRFPLAALEDRTAGRYSRIVAPLGRQIEAVEHRDGTIVAVGDLSTGTAQQLYLAIRFGLVEHFSEAAEPLPIVMDDILVNFDDERAELAARSIEHLAERHQVMYFTCHPGTPLVGGLQVQLDRLETVGAIPGLP